LTVTFCGAGAGVVVVVAAGAGFLASDGSPTLRARCAGATGAIELNNSKAAIGKV
jgi:hypothetical protein